MKVLSRLPHYALGGEFRKMMCLEIDAALRTSDDKRDSHFQLEPKDLVVIRSDPSLQIEERSLIASTQTIRDSPIILDYLQFFDHLLPKSIFSDDDRKLLELYKDYPISTEPPPPAARRDTMGDVQTYGLKYTQVTVKYYYYNKFVDRVVEQLCKAANVLGSLLLNEDLSFDSIAFQVFDGLLHFCSDLYYLTPARSQLVRVLPLGRVKFFGCAGTPQFTSLHGRRDVNFEKELLPLLINSDYHIGLLGETAASSEVLPSLVERLKDDQTIFIAPSTSRLRAWVRKQQRTQPTKSKRYCVVIADVDVLENIKMNVDFTLPFSNVGGYPVGFVYPLGDSRWRSAMATAVAETLTSLGNSPAQVWEYVSSDLRRVGVEPLRGDELLRELLLDMNHMQAIYWQHQLRWLLSSEPADCERPDG